MGDANIPTKYQKGVLGYETYETWDVSLKMLKGGSTIVLSKADRDMKQHFSAGGVLVDKRRRIYLVHKQSRDEWVLPKGGLEEGESALKTAEREIREETGYQNIEALKPKPLKASTWIFTSEGSGEKEQKTVYYFLFQLIDENRTKTSEMVGEGLEGDWFSFEEAIEKVSFDNLQEVLKAARGELESH